MYPNDEIDGWGQQATESEAHAEWHRNTGVPMGTPGCPQDACHGEDSYDGYDLEAAGAAELDLLDPPEFPIRGER